MARREIEHNTPEQVRGYLAAALELVEDLDPPEDLRQMCFVKAVDLGAAKTIQEGPPVGVGLGMTIPRG